MSTWQDEYVTLLDDWGRGFVDSLRRQIEQGRRPTPKQIEALDRAWERATARG